MILNAVRKVHLFASDSPAELFWKLLFEGYKMRVT